MKGMILEGSLPDNLAQEYKLLQKTQNISFSAFMGKLEERYARGQPMVARKKIEKVELPSSGRIKTDDFKLFEIQFTDALKNIRDTASKRPDGCFCARCQIGCACGLLRRK